MTKTKICVICGRDFIPSSPNRQTCSLECRGKLMSEKAKAVAKQRPFQFLTKICPICGKQFKTPLNRKHTYCSPECASKRAPLMVWVKCAVCGKDFLTPKNTKTAKTCSPECRKIHISQKAKGYDLSFMKEGHKKNPKTNSSPLNCLAKEWSLLSPDGIIYKFKNLSYFVKTHKDLFPQHLLRERRSAPFVAKRLSELAPWRRSKRKRPTHVYGWTWAE